MSAKMRTALVISGGGAKGAFAVGVLKYLFNNYRKDGWFAIIGGTSTGALIAPLAALMGGPEQMAKEAMATLEDIYTSVSTTDILERQGVFELLNRQDCLYESDPLNGLIHRHLRPEWFAWLKGPEAPYCYVVYTNYQSGQKVTISPKDAGVDRERFIKGMMASASVPVIMEATIIDEDVCYDGGVRDLLPFSDAIDQGAEKIVPIFLDPEEFPVTRSRFRRLDKVLLRTLQILVDEAGRNDLQMAELINIAVQAKEELLVAFADDPAKQRRLLEVFSRHQRLFGPEKRLISIVKGLRPDLPLTEDSLTFDPVKMRSWVDLGEQKARQVIQQSPFA